MKVVVQCIPDRLEYIKNVCADLDPHIHVDTEMKGPLPAFLDMLDYKHKGYQLYLQDDVILADDFHTYLSTIENIAEMVEADVLCLYMPNQKVVRQMYANGGTIQPLKTCDWWIQGTVFSPRFLNLLRKEKAQGSWKQTKPAYSVDNWLTYVVCKKHNLRVFQHVPGIVQLNLEDLKSSIGHATSSQRVSTMYHADYITNRNEALSKK